MTESDARDDGGVNRSLHPQNGRISDEGLRLGEYLNYYRFQPVFIAINGETKHDSPMCPELEGSYRMICREDALYAYGERWCETCQGHQKRVDFPAESEKQLIADGGTNQLDGQWKRGIYMLADTPLSATPLALEDGSGDKNLLAEAIVENLTSEEIDDLIQHLITQRVNEEHDGTAIVCEDCGHVRQTDEKYPTLANCQSCGSYNLRYADEEVSADV